MSYGIHPYELMEHVILPTLILLDDKVVENSSPLLLGIAAVESNCGKYLMQINGPACGIFQMEPATEKAVWQYLGNKTKLKEKIIAFVGGYGLNEVSNLAYQVAIARANLYRFKEALPSGNDISAMAGYWKKYWNTPLGKGKEEDFVSKYPIKDNIYSSAIPCEIH